jgi:hypothetical protein
MTDAEEDGHENTSPPPGDADGEDATTELPSIIDETLDPKPFDPAGR